MKKLALLSLVVFLSGCAQIKMMLVKHDPALASMYVQTEVNLEVVDCTNKETFKPAVASSHLMAKYAEFRNDPQKDSATAVYTNINKAVSTKEEAVCKRWVNLANSRMSILKKAWSDR